MVNIKEPFVLKNFYSEEDHAKVLNTALSHQKSEWEYQDYLGRYILRNRWTDRLGVLETDRAREIFDSSGLLFSYSLIAIYNQPTSKLNLHKDDNACTYTIDVAIKSNEPWPLIIEDKEYIANDNEAICFYGNAQLHGRPPFKKGNSVMVMFLHYVEKNHWWFEKSNKECI